MGSTGHKKNARISEKRKGTTIKPLIPESSSTNNFTANVLREVADERHRQLSLWGAQLHRQTVWYSILGEEFGEVGKAINQGNHEEYRNELLQVAAVAVAAVEALDKNKVLDAERYDPNRC